LTLFEEKSRNQTGRKLRTQRDFDFLERISWPECENIRNLLNFLTNDPIIKNETDIIQRINSGNDTNFKSAVFELFLYTMLKKLNFDLIFHPTLDSNNEYRPDFLDISPNGDEFYLEATHASPNDGTDIASERRRASLMEEIEKINVDRFRLAIDIEEQSTIQPSGRNIRRHIEKWLGELSYSNSFNWMNLPETKWSKDDWVVRITAIPVDEGGARDIDDPTIGIESFGARWVNNWMPLRDACAKKVESTENSTNHWL
jgi:hypothetical protein